MMGQTQSETHNLPAASAIRVTHVLGFEGVRQNASGELTIQGDALQFQRDGSPPALVSMSSIREISLGDEDKQVGGVPMMLAKTAVPYGGGRVASLFSHKRYDILTIEYLDNNDGYHGAIFQLKKGQGQGFKSDLIANGAHIAPPDHQAPTQATPEVKNETK
jgi:hypothetical protein